MDALDTGSASGKERDGQALEVLNRQTASSAGEHSCQLLTAILSYTVVPRLSSTLFQCDRPLIDEQPPFRTPSTDIVVQWSAAFVDRNGS
ncbi:hypothetical protein M422DRAFT_781364 [Sphaerobolus stellatus SS14]|uniref:Uncharacterized protein n=1 Tax=Sphaerobolus stellatus (strain SS14) TaxID=990650 RepID=A0A0C9VLJ8_SPHS4|nr:hypothetical protein M422DRAFT_781364 [Sphaerobolus stellatus SS14]